MVLKRKISILFTLVICLFALFALTACGVTEKTEKNEEQEEEKYTETEKNFVEALDTILIDMLKDPASLKITKILGSWCDGKLIAFTCTSNNSFGGAVSSSYIIATKGFTFEKSMAPDYLDNANKYIGTTILKGYCVDYALITDTLSIPSGDVQWAISYIADYGDEINRDDVKNITVANVNALLNQYKEEQGWI